jgi:hypothetical protein
MTAPELSLVCPEIVLCAEAMGENSDTSEKPVKANRTVIRVI